MSYRLSVVIAVFCLICGLTLPSVAEIADETLPATADIVSYAKPAVVFINHRDELGRQMTGTGFMISENGYVLTCAHVVAPSKPPSSKTKSKGIVDKIWVRTTNGITSEAERMYCDVDSDIALLALPGGPYQYLYMSNLLPTQGEEVVVIGYPMGQILGKEAAVTRGIVSALRLDGVIFQLDAATNPGNSGGPVLNRYGMVSGIAFAKIKGFEGMNFAISSASIPSIREMLQLSPKLGPWFITAVENDDTSTVKALLELKPQLVSLKNKDGTPVLQLVKSVEMAKMLVEKGADVNGRTEYGETPLQSAAFNGQTEVAEYLISVGSKVSARGQGGGTPLHWAATAGQLAVAQLLIKSGAIVEAKDDEGETPLFWIAGSPYVWTEQGLTAKYLIQCGAKVSATDKKGRTPLHEAATENILVAAKLLVEAGADINVKDIEGQTPLHVAADHGSSDVAKYLTDIGANVNARDNRGKTPLKIAIRPVRKSQEPGDFAQIMDEIEEKTAKPGRKAIAILLRNHGGKL